MSERRLRDYQIEAIAAVRTEWAAGVNRTAIVLPTGAGKTDCIAKIATDEARSGGRVMVVAHRSELLDQITERCKMHASDIPVGRIQASKNQGRRPITVAMAPTLAHEKRRDRLQRPTLIICDEAHHAASPSQMKILAWAGSFDHTRTLGVTATMARGDKRGLGDVWSSIAYQKSLQWAVEQGWLVRPRGRVVVTDHMDLNAAKINRGDYADSDLAPMVSQDVDQIVKAWSEQAPGRPTIAFTPNVQSAEDLTREFLAQGITAELVVGTTSHADRQKIYARVSSGETRVLTNCMVGTEGFDLPALSCALMCRPTRSAPLYQQMVGRVLRRYPGKETALILDVVGASRHQKLVTLIDLSPSAEIDTTELDALPCDICGGYTDAQRKRMGDDAWGAAPCTCSPDATDRDPDGGRVKLLGPATYSDVEDMFSTSSLNWLFTHGGIRFLPAGDRMAILFPDGDNYLAGHCTVRGYDEGRYVGQDGHWDPIGPLPLNEARQRAEAWALVVDPTVASRGAGWRKRGGSPSEAQVKFAANLGVSDPETMSKPRLSDEISIALASRVLG